LNAKHIMLPLPTPIVIAVISYVNKVSHFLDGCL